MGEKVGREICAKEAGVSKKEGVMSRKKGERRQLGLLKV